MVTSGRAVLSFDDTGDVWVFASLQDAASWMEAVDVEAGEYDAGVFTHDGHIVEVTTLGDRTVLDVRPERDEPRLWALLAEGRRWSRPCRGRKATRRPATVPTCGGSLGGPNGVSTGTARAPETNE